MMNISSSVIDEQRFGIRTVKASRVLSDDFPSMMRFCIDHNCELLIARCDTNEIALVQRMERQGFELMDTMVYYFRDIANNPIPNDSNQNIKIRPVQNGEEKIVKAIASKTFKGYRGHYHADKRLDSTQCDDVYASWAYRSCFSGGVADLMLVAENHEGRIVGFTSFLNNSKERGCGLSGVDPESKGQGVYRSLIMNGLKWSLSMGDEIVVYDTQLTNIAVQKAWIKMGFLPTQSCYTFHKWFV